MKGEIFIQDDTNWGTVYECLGDLEDDIDTPGQFEDGDAFTVYAPVGTAKVVKHATVEITYNKGKK